MIGAARGWFILRDEARDTLSVRGVQIGAPELFQALVFYAPLVALAMLLGGWVWGLGALVALSLLCANRFEVRVDATGLHITEWSMVAGFFPCVERTHMSHRAQVERSRDPRTGRADGLFIRHDRPAWSAASGLTFVPMRHGAAEATRALLLEELERRR